MLICVKSAHCPVLAAGLDAHDGSPRASISAHLEAVLADLQNSVQAVAVIVRTLAHGVNQSAGAPLRSSPGALTGPKLPP